MLVILVVAELLAANVALPRRGVGLVDVFIKPGERGKAGSTARAIVLWL